MQGPAPWPVRLGLSKRCFYGRQRHLHRRRGAWLGLPMTRPSVSSPMAAQVISQTSTATIRDEIKTGQFEDRNARSDKPTLICCKTHHRLWFAQQGREGRQSLALRWGDAGNSPDTVKKLG